MKNKNQTPKTLSAKVAAKYKLVNILPGEVEFDGKNWDFTIMTAEDADDFYARQQTNGGFKYLEPLGSPANKTVSGGGGDKDKEKEKQS